METYVVSLHPVVRRGLDTHQQRAVLADAFLKAGVEKAVYRKGAADIALDDDSLVLLFGDQRVTVRSTVPVAAKQRPECNI